MNSWKNCNACKRYEMCGHTGWKSLDLWPPRTRGPTDHGVRSSNALPCEDFNSVNVGFAVELILFAPCMICDVCNIWLQLLIACRLEFFETNTTSTRISLRTRTRHRRTGLSRTRVRTLLLCLTSHGKCIHRYVVESWQKSCDNKTKQRPYGGVHYPRPPPYTAILYIL
jgi:hypothetical protein